MNEKHESEIIVKSFSVTGPFIFSGTIKPRILFVCGLAVLLGFVVAWIAKALVGLIGLVTNLAFYGRWSLGFSSPSYNHLGAWVILIPIIGGIAVGLMARYGSAAIRGHGIPEAMEQVLLNSKPDSSTSCKFFQKKKV